MWILVVVVHSIRWQRIKLYLACDLRELRHRGRMRASTAVLGFRDRRGMGGSLGKRASIIISTLTALGSVRPADVPDTNTCRQIDWNEECIRPGMWPGANGFSLVKRRR